MNLGALMPFPYALTSLGWATLADLDATRTGRAHDRCACATCEERRAAVHVSLDALLGHHAAAPLSASVVR